MADRITYALAFKAIWRDCINQHRITVRLVRVGDNDTLDYLSGSDTFAGFHLDYRLPEPTDPTFEFWRFQYEGSSVGIEARDAQRMAKGFAPAK